MRASGPRLLYSCFGSCSLFACNTLPAPPDQVQGAAGASRPLFLCLAFPRQPGWHPPLLLSDLLYSQASFCPLPSALYLHNSCACLSQKAAGTPRTKTPSESLAVVSARHTCSPMNIRGRGEGPFSERSSWAPPGGSHLCHPPCPSQGAGEALCPSQSALYRSHVLLPPGCESQYPGQRWPPGSTENSTRPEVTEEQGRVGNKGLSWGRVDIGVSVTHSNRALGFPATLRGQRPLSLWSLWSN